MDSNHYPSVDTTRHHHDCLCQFCKRNKTGYYGQFENPTMDAILYRLRILVPYLKQQLREMDDSLTTLDDLVARVEASGITL